MARGRPPKPIAIHKMQGTYRKDRHGAGAEMERRVVAMTQDKCSFCGQRRSDDLPLATNDSDTSMICPNCVAGAVLLFESLDWNMIPDELLPKYGCTPEADEEARETG